MNECSTEGHKFDDDNCETKPQLSDMSSYIDAEYIDLVQKYINETVPHKKAMNHPNGVFAGIKSIGGYGAFFKSLF